MAPEAPTLLGTSTYPNDIQWAELHRVGDSLVTTYDRLYIQPLQCTSVPADVVSADHASDLAFAVAPNPFNPGRRSASNYPRRPPPRSRSSTPGDGECARSRSMGTCRPAGAR